MLVFGGVNDPYVLKVNPPQNKAFQTKQLKAVLGIYHLYIDW